MTWRPCAGPQPPPKVDKINDLPEMRERGDSAFRRLARVYLDSTFRHGFEVRDLTDLHEVCLCLDSSALQSAAERAVQLLLSDSVHPVLFGASALEGDDRSHSPHTSRSDGLQQ